MNLTTERVYKNDRARVFTLLDAVGYEDEYVKTYYDFIAEDSGVSQMFLASDANTHEPVGCYHLALLKNNQGVVGAGRIHPKFQSSGYAKALFPYILQHIYSLGVITIHSLILTDNIRSQRMIAPYPFEKLGVWQIGFGNLSEIVEGEAADVAPALSQDIDFIQQHFGSEIIADGLAYWLRALDLQDVSLDALLVVRKNKSVSGFMVRSYVQNEVLIKCVYGDAKSVQHLLSYVKKEAEQQGCTRYQLSIPHNEFLTLNNLHVYYTYRLRRNI